MFRPNPFRLIYDHDAKLLGGGEDFVQLDA